MPDSQRFPSLGKLLGAAARRTFARPFIGLLGLSVFVAVASAAVRDPDLVLFSVVLLLVVESYVEIGVILAAARRDPDPSMDRWIRAAFARRVFWRYTLTNLVTFLIVGFGFVALLVPGFIAAGAFGLAPAVAVLQRKLPGEALRHSRELTRPAFALVAVSFGVLQAAPSVALQLGVSLAPEASTALFATLNLGVVLLARIGTLAVVEVFVQVGAEVEPESAAPGP